MQNEEDKNLMVVAEVEGYGLNHNMATKDVCQLFKNNVRGIAMNNKYIYNGEDITLDVVMKIEKIVRLIAEKENREFDKVYSDFSGSRTYAALQNTKTLMWAESEEFIVDEYEIEIGEN